MTTLAVVEWAIKKYVEEYPNFLDWPPYVFVEVLPVLTDQTKLRDLQLLRLHLAVARECILRIIRNFFTQSRNCVGSTPRSSAACAREERKSERKCVVPHVAFPPALNCETGSEQSDTALGHWPEHGHPSHYLQVSFIAETAEVLSL